MTGVQTCALPICFPVTIPERYCGIFGAWERKEESKRNCVLGGKAMKKRGRPKGPEKTRIMPMVLLKTAQTLAALAFKRGQTVGELLDELVKQTNTTH